LPIHFHLKRAGGQVVLLRCLRSIFYLYRLSNLAGQVVAADGDLTAAASPYRIVEKMRSLQKWRAGIEPACMLTHCLMVDAIGLPYARPA